MFRTARVLAVTCVIASLVLTPWNTALASERQASTTDQTPSQPADDAARGNDHVAAHPPATGVREGSLLAGALSTLGDGDRSGGAIWSSGFPPVPNDSRRLTRRSQSVASTTEPKLLLGAIAGTLIVAGVALLAYGATSTCKGSHPNDTTCDRNAVMGAVGLSGGTVMLVVWALSR